MIFQVQLATSNSGYTIFRHIQTLTTSYNHSHNYCAWVQYFNISMSHSISSKLPITSLKSLSGSWFQPLWKIVVNWDENKNVPNHQPAIKYAKPLASIHPTPAPSTKAPCFRSHRRSSASNGTVVPGPWTASSASWGSSHNKGRTNQVSYLGKLEYFINLSSSMVRS